jgi:hypothetical protein
VADFADKKKVDKAEKKVAAPSEHQSKPRAIRSLIENRPPSEKKESPFDGLSREMRGGFKRLEDKLGERSPKERDFAGQPTTYNYSYNNHSNTTINSPAREKPQFKSPEASSVRAPVIGAITGATPATAPRASFGAPASVAPIADQRAHQAFASGRAAHIEADATRMAKISEASEKMKKGEFPPNPKIREWAGAIRSGHQRQIADLDPKMVNRTLEHAAGGSHGAQQLNTPKVARLEAEHQSKAQVLQKGLEARRESLERGHEANPAHVAPNAAETKIHAVASAAHQPAHLQEPGRPDRPERHEPGRPDKPERQEARGFPSSNPNTAPVHQIQSPDLTSMLRNNDETHSLSAVASIESAQKQQTSGGKAESAKRSEVKPIERMEMPKIGSVSSAPAGLRSEASGPQEPKKAPWGEGREMREVADTLREILTAVERIG